MKNITKRLLCALLIFTSIFSLCSCWLSNRTYEEKIIKTSVTLLEVWDHEHGRTFSVAFPDANTCRADINGTELLIEFPKKEHNFRNQPKNNITDCEEQYTDIIKKSKDLAIEFIKQSIILKDKNNLIEYIKNIPVKMADFDSILAAELNEENDTVYLNKKDRENICAYTITHTLVYAISRKTNEQSHNVKYQNTIFNEVINELIVYRLHPESVDGLYNSKFDQSGIWGELYCGCAEIDALDAYFYGYDKLFDKIPENELDAFVKALDVEYYEESDDINILMSNCINEWAVEKCNREKSQN